ncbi:MAG TPA: substrate-binding and VWA domain-containing protein [Anaerolineae bacterium]|nr:substrate-binding and VWA domain-containing protein [Anaerolineae bacterium]
MSTRRSPSIDRRWILAFLVAALVLVLACCWLASAAIDWVQKPRETPTPAAGGTTGFTVAYSPEKQALFTQLASEFNRQGATTPEGQPIQVDIVPLAPDAMLDAMVGGSATFQAITPDSSIWLEQLDTEWGDAHAGAQAVGETVRYAVSPVVIAMWESKAREMGWPQNPVSWQDLLSRAQADPSFRWSHPSTSAASGVLAVLAEFYAAAGKTRGLTIEDVKLQANLDYVAALEKTVRYYGEGDETALVERALSEGAAFLDAFVVQEQMVVYFNQARQGQERLVALYPAEGTLWQDHPLALLETAALTTYQRQAFARFQDYLLSAEAQKLILDHGYRPSDYTIPHDGPGSPITAENGADPAEPQTTLQVPGASVISVVRDVWWYTKRHANVYLVADRSGSMSSEDKLPQAKLAFSTFLDQIQGDSERVGLITFSSFVETTVPIAELGSNRTALQMAIGQLEAGGDTALLDAVDEAYRQLQAYGDTERINAIVVMTDGKENASYTSLRGLVTELSRSSSVEVLVFCVAYGDDADMEMLQAIAEPSGGRALRGDPETIQSLYKILSQYF